MNDFWEYCKDVAAFCSGDRSVNATRFLINDIETVAACFDAKWTPVECFDTLTERDDLLPARDK